ncbi:1,4-dihydroxy-2-naphthoate octaprenyltransferase [Paenibacillus albidus]|uniref:1,4-dihydroxy-2-naphthoate octaprenyltransferase n=1 Tax=Paenibacillus albidus TaxID=2041023 RepID=A0A917FS27_9BACL|nr:prenyltransferase [Paenibacillus albidus]GGF97437.1 1,4-dihydroxy-2-naphthoate octaprenyltransferase [Paenibacillus albidus]
MNKWTLFKKASRFGVIPVMLIPIVLGSVGAYVWEGTFHPFLFGITFIGGAAAHLFSNMVNDLWDFRNGTDVEAERTPDIVTTNSGFLSRGVLSERTFAALTWSLLAVAVLCGALLSVYSGSEILWFVAAGALIAYFYVAPPLRFGYRGMGYSEAAIFAAFGLMPVLGSYFVQTGQFSMKPVLLSLPVGLLTTLLLFNHHFLHWKADQQAGKRTLVVVWGERKALVFSRILLYLSYASLVVCVLLDVLPFYALLALLTAIPPVHVYRGLQQHNASPAYLPLMGASLQASVRCGAIMAAALLVQAFI